MPSPSAASAGGGRSSARPAAAHVPAALSMPGPAAALPEKMGMLPYYVSRERHREAMITHAPMLCMVRVGDQGNTGSAPIFQAGRNPRPLHEFHRIRPRIRGHVMRTPRAVLVC